MLGFRLANIGLNLTYEIYGVAFSADHLTPLDVF